MILLLAALIFARRAPAKAATQTDPFYQPKVASGPIVQSPPTGKASAPSKPTIDISGLGPIVINQPADIGKSLGPQPTPYQEELGRQEDKRLEAEVDDCIAFSRRGNYAAAKRRLIADIWREPWMLVLPTALLDLYIEHEDFEEGYRFSTVYLDTAVRDSFTVSPDILLRISLISASCGHVAPRQGEYCRGWLVAQPEFEGSPEFLPQDDSPRSVAFLSNMAIARHFYGSGFEEKATPYLERAIKLEPGNAYASFELAGCYRKVHRYSEAIELMEEILPASGSGRLHDILLIDLNNLRTVQQMLADGKIVVPPPTPLRTVGRKPSP